MEQQNKYRAEFISPLIFIFVASLCCRTLNTFQPEKKGIHKKFIAFLDNKMNEKMEKLCNWIRKYRFLMEMSFFVFCVNKYYSDGIMSFNLGSFFIHRKTLLADKRTFPS